MCSTSRLLVEQFNLPNNYLNPTLDDSSVDKADVLFISETFSYVFQTLKTSLLFLLLNTIFLMVLFFG